MTTPARHEMFRDHTVVLMDGRLDSSFAALWALHNIPGKIVGAVFIADGLMQGPDIYETAQWVGDRLGLEILQLKATQFVPGPNGRAERRNENMIRGVAELGARRVVIGTTRWFEFYRGAPECSTLRDLESLCVNLGVQILAPASAWPRFAKGLLLRRVGIPPVRLVP